MMEESVYLFADLDPMNGPWKYLFVGLVLPPEALYLFVDPS